MDVRCCSKVVKESLIAIKDSFNKVASNSVESVYRHLESESNKEADRILKRIQDFMISVTIDVLHN